MKRRRVLFCETATIVCGVHPKRVIFKYMLPMAAWKVTFPTKVPLSRKNKSFHNGVYAIMEDKEKNIWLGTKGAGLFLLTPKSLNQYSITHFKHRSEDPYSISDNSIYSIFQDSRNRIWIGCYGGGLNLFTPGSNGSPYLSTVIMS